MDSFYVFAVLQPRGNDRENLSPLIEYGPSDFGFLFNVNGEIFPALPMRDDTIIVGSGPLKGDYMVMSRFFRMLPENEEPQRPRVVLHLSKRR